MTSGIQPTVRRAWQQATSYLRVGVCSIFHGRGAVFGHLEWHWRHCLLGIGYHNRSGQLETILEVSVCVLFQVLKTQICCSCASFWRDVGPMVDAMIVLNADICYDGDGSSARSLIHENRHAGRVRRKSCAIYQQHPSAEEDPSINVVCVVGWYFESQSTAEIGPC